MIELSSSQKLGFLGFWRLAKDFRKTAMWDPSHDLEQAQSWIPDNKPPKLSPLARYSANFWNDEDLVCQLSYSKLSSNNNG